MILLAALLWPACAAPLTIAAAGDLQLSAERTLDPLTALPSLLVGELRLVNLEGPLTAEGLSPAPAGVQRLRGRPAQAAWLRGRVDVALLENNHIDDAGPRGRAETRLALRAQGLHVAEAAAPLLLRRNGQAVAVLARSYGPEGPLLDATLLAQISALSRSHLVIVSLHWGHTGSLLPSPAQRAFAARLVDAGARLVLGHGPHSPQGLELRHGPRGESLIAYSLGNLSFDCACTKERDAFVLSVRFLRGGRLADAGLRPLRAGLGDAPARANDPELDELLTRLSADLATTLSRAPDGSLRVALPDH